MPYDTITRLTSEALMLCLMLSLPAVLASAAIGLLVSFVQAVTSIQDSSIPQGVKLIGVTVVVAIASPWAGATMVAFADKIFTAVFQ
jgi:type III secretion protein S